MSKEFYDLLFDSDFGVFTGMVGMNQKYKTIAKENGCMLVFNVVGIDKDNINVDVETQYGRQMLHISGETKNEVLKTDYKLDQRFTVRKDIELVDCKVENGLLYVDITFKQPEKANVNVTWK